MRGLGHLKLLGRLGDLEAADAVGRAAVLLQPDRQAPFPPRASARYRVAFLAGCIANISFARLNEATVRVLQRNGCEVVVPGGQGCCGALHVHAGCAHEARKLARRNIDAMLDGGFDAIITNAAGCGSTLKEYGELLEDDPAYAEKARDSPRLMKDVTEFLAGIELNPKMGPVHAPVTYQDSCHLAHGQKIRNAPRQLLGADAGPGVPGDGGRRSLLRQRRHLQRGAERNGDADPGDEDGVGERTRRADRSPRRIRDACCNCRPASGCTARTSA